MLTCPTHLPIYFCTQPVDFRKSFDGLTGVITLVFGSNVLNGHLFLFINKRRDRIKAMWWDRDGMVITYKRLEQGTFEIPGISGSSSGSNSPSKGESQTGAPSAMSRHQTTHVTIDATQLSMLLGGVALAGAKQRRKRLTIDG
jgi:hypothetical protein